MRSFVIAVLFVVSIFAADVPEVDIRDSLSLSFLDENPRELIGNANDAYQKGEYETAAKWYIQYLRHDPSDGGSVYNLACCYGLLGEAELAAHNLKRSYNKGFEDIEHMRNDPDFEKVRDEQVFIEALDTIAKIDEYLASISGEVKLYRDYTLHACNVIEPEDFDRKASYPLLIGLHGWGADAEGFVKIASRMGDDLPFIFACPQAPYPFDPGGGMGFSWEMWMPDTLQAKEYRNMSKEYVLNTVDRLKDDYNVTDVYLIGFSQGAGMAMSLGIEYPDIFSAAIPWGGWLDEGISDETLAAAKDQPILIVHGTEDRIVEFESAESSLKRLQSAGFKDVSILSFEGGHQMPEQQLQMAADWLKERIR